MKKKNKYYKLTINYIVGDADGEIKRSSVISVNNPFLHVLTEALEMLRPRDGYWGIDFIEEDYKDNLEKGNISLLQYDLLNVLTGQDIPDEDIYDFLKKHNYEESLFDYILEFDTLIESEYLDSFLTYKGYKLV